MLLDVKLGDAAALAFGLVSRIRSANYESSIRSHLYLPRINKDRFVIFSLSRSGSTTLGEILQCHPQVRCAFEPFSPDTDMGRTYGCEIKDRARLEASLSKLWKKYNGIKHVWSWGGYPFQMAPKRQALNHHLLAISNAKVILLRRKNVLKRILSDSISKQSGNWQSSMSAREAHLRYDFRPLNVGRIRFLLRRESDAIASCRDALIRSQVPFIDVCYEDLYGEENLLNTGPRKVREIISFLGLGEFDERGWQQVMSLLDPQRMKANSHATYLRIPNIDEIERVLGADETGWLFR